MEPTEWGFTRREALLILLVALLLAVFFGLASADWVWVEL